MSKLEEGNGERDRMAVEAAMATDRVQDRVAKTAGRRPNSYNAPLLS